MNLNKELEIAFQAALEAQKAILSVYNSTDFGTEMKFDNSPVTKADKAADNIIRDILIKNFPNYGILTEESQDDKSRLDKEYVWIVDPVDGTKDFISRNGEFTINIGLSYKHKPVLGVVMIPVSGEIYYGVLGLGSFYKQNFESNPIKIHCNDKKSNLTVLMSRFHTTDGEKELIHKYGDKITNISTIGAAIKGCYIASGKAELSFRTSSNTKEWDTCAMQAIIEQAGGYILKFDKTPITYNRENVYNEGGYIICNILDNFL